MKITRLIASLTPADQLNWLPGSHKVALSLTHSPFQPPNRMKKFKSVKSESKCTHDDAFGLTPQQISVKLNRSSPA